MILFSSQESNSGPLSYPHGASPSHHRYPPYSIDNRKGRARKQNDLEQLAPLRESREREFQSLAGQRTHSHPHTQHSVNLTV